VAVVDNKSHSKDIKRKNKIEANHRISVINLNAVQVSEER